MNPKTLAVYAGTTDTEIERLLALKPDELYADSGYQMLVDQLEITTLENSMREARQAVDANIQRIKIKHDLLGTMMSGYTLVNWTIGFLQHPQKLPDLLIRHRNLSPDMIMAALPDILDVLGSMEQGAAHWQRALVVLSIPLMV